jgi:DNA mismatch repair ATPase MutL
MVKLFCKDQSSKRLPDKTPKKPNMSMKDEDEVSPTIKKMINEELDNRMKANNFQELQQGLKKRLFQDETDEEEEARRQYEENLEKMKQANERVKKNSKPKRMLD